MSATAVELAILLTAKDAASGVVSGVTQKFAALGTAGKLAGIAIAAAGGAVLGSIAGLTALANKSAAAAGEVAKLKRETGLTAIEASKLRFVGERLGVDTEALSKSFGILSKSLESTHPSLAKYNIEVVKAKDGHVLMDPTLGNIAARFKSMPDGVEKTALAMDIFGKSGKDMIPILNQGRDGLKALGDEAARLGLTFDDKALAAAKRYKLAQKDLSDNIDGLKNRLGMAFLPILADVSSAMLTVATAVFPVVVGAIDKVRAAFFTATGVIKDMVDAAHGKLIGGGDFLASIIGAKGADEFMTTVRNVSLTLNHFWELVIKPAFRWIEANAPIIWENVKTTILEAWKAIEPKLEAFVGKLGDLKAKFEALPGPVKEALEKVALTAVVVKATGLDDWIMNVTGAIQGAGGLSQGIVAMRGHWLAAIASFVTVGAVILAVASVSVAVYEVASAIGEVRDHWEPLRKAVHEGSLDNSNAVEGFLVKLVEWGDMFDRLGVKTRQTLADWGKIFQDFGYAVALVWAGIEDAIITVWRGVLKIFTTTVNNMIDTINPLWTKLGNPPIAHIEITLPEADNISRTLDWIARDRSARILIDAGFNQEYADKRGYAAGTPFVPYTGPAIVHRGERIIPAAENVSGNWGGGGGSDHDHSIIINLDGREIARVVSDRVSQQYRLAGGKLGPY